MEESTTTAGNGTYAAELRNVCKEYQMGGGTVRAVSDVSLTIEAGEFTAIIGPSGSGKSTLLDILGGIARPSSGAVFINGQDISNLSDGELSAIRARRVGFVFQNYSLIDVLNAYENIEYPLMLLKRSESERRKRVSEMLERVGLERFAKHRPAELSGGQCQRVAIARALAAEPTFVLADEPTANLDSEMGASIMDLMIDLNRTVGTTFIFASHDPALVERTRKVVRIKDGKIVQS